MAKCRSRYPGHIVPQDPHRSRIFPEHEVGGSHDKGSPRRVERIEPHVSLEYIDRPPSIPCKDKGQAEAPVDIVWVQRDSSFELSNRCIVLAHPRKDQTEY